MFQKILVPLDGSTNAEMAIPYVEEIATRFGSEVVLVRVREPGEGNGEARQYYLHLKEEDIKQAMKASNGDTEVKVHSLVPDGKPADEILFCASEQDADLIAIASRGASEHGPWALGSIASKLLRATHIPVLLIKVPVDDTAVRQHKQIKKILLPLDGSKIGEAAIPYTIELAKGLGTELVVLFQFLETPTIGITPAAIVEIGTNLKTSAIAYLKKTEESVKEQGLDASIAVIDDIGSAANHIIDYAEENDIDLIAMSTLGRSGIGRWVFGSVTDKVLHAGDIPVLAVRATRD